MANNKSTDDLISTIIIGIDSDIVIANEFVELLEQERSAIEIKDIDLLEAINEKKSQALLQLSQNQTQRDSIQKQLGVESGNNGLAKIFKNIDANKYPQALKTIKSLESVTKKINNFIFFFILYFYIFFFFFFFVFCFIFLFWFFSFCFF